MALSVSGSGGGSGKFNLSFSGAPTAGDNELVAAVPGYSVRVHSLTICGGGGDNAVYLKTGSTGRFGGTAGKLTVNAAGPAVGISVPQNPDGLFSGSAGEALTLTASTTEALFGVIQYSLVQGDQA